MRGAAKQPLETMTTKNASKPQTTNAKGKGKPASSPQTPPVAPVVSPAAPTRDPMGNRLITRSHVINAAIFKLCGASNRPVKLKEIVAAIKTDPTIAALAKRYCESHDKPEVGAIPAHLRYLQGYRNGQSSIVAVPQITLTPLGYVLCDQHVMPAPAPKKKKGKGKTTGK